jgi:hypothetical protein
LPQAVIITLTVPNCDSENILTKILTILNQRAEGSVYTKNDRNITKYFVEIAKNDDHTIGTWMVDCLTGCKPATVRLDRAPTTGTNLLV